MKLKMLSIKGATELDVVINIGWLKAGKVDAVHQELANICALLQAKPSKQF